VEARGESQNAKQTSAAYLRRDADTGVDDQKVENSIFFGSVGCVNLAPAYSREQGGCVAGRVCSSSVCKRAGRVCNREGVAGKGCSRVQVAFGIISMVLYY
jgi:hypothetical protein